MSKPIPYIGITGVSNLDDASYFEKFVPKFKELLRLNSLAPTRFTKSRRKAPGFSRGDIRRVKNLVRHLS